MDFSGASSFFSFLFFYKDYKDFMDFSGCVAVIPYNP